MIIKQHPSLPLWIREDGAVCVPPDGYRFFKFRWTYGSKNGKEGYMVVQFRGKKYRVHRLVAEAFNIPNPEGYKEIDHKDRNPQNNAVSNLRWADRKMQSNNRQVCEDSLARYGVRACENENAYRRARYAKDPKVAKRERARQRKRRARDPEQYRLMCREYEAKQRAQGKRRRKCPDGVRRFLTDEEFNERYKKG